MAETTGGSVRNARMDTCPPHAGQSRGRTAARTAWAMSAVGLVGLALVTLVRRARRIAP